MYDKFRKLLAEKIHNSRTPDSVEKVQILSVMETTGGTDVRFSAHGSPWYSSGKMNGVVTENLNEVNKIRASVYIITMVALMAIIEWL